MIQIRMVLLWALLVLLSSPVLAQKPALSAEQRSFQAAIAAIKAGNTGEFNRRKKQLEHFSLYPYLEYRQLSKNLSTSSDRTIRKFIKRNQANPLGRRMHKIWLKSLARKQAWSRYQKAWSDTFATDDTLLCHYARAGQQTHVDITEIATELWLSGSSRPKACDPVFKTMQQRGDLTNDLLWQRFLLSLHKRNKGLGSYLSKKLPVNQRDWYRWWSEMDKNPAATVRLLAREKDSAPVREFLVYGIKRYARQDTVDAMQLWKTNIKYRFLFSRQQINDIERSIALRTAWRHESVAIEYLDALDDSAVNQEVSEWRVRSALRQLDWPGVERQIKRLSAIEQNKPQWQYWTARSLQERGHTADANTLYRTLKEKTGYYGFLAAQKNGSLPNFNSITVVGDDELDKVASLALEPAFTRARLLRELGMDLDASREWSMAIESLDKDSKRLAAKLASQLGWHFRAIATVAQAGHFADLELRFPVLHEDLIRKEARRNRIEPGWVYGVIRRESAWREDVVSPAGAIGLMQLMPRTARQMAKKVGMRRPVRSQIKSVKKNIRLGTAYLREVLDKYDNHEILATASYNAGPHRVKAWLPEGNTLPADIWIDTITFDETRNYVKAVFAYSTIMDWKLGEKGRDINDRLRIVAPYAYYSS